MVPKMTPDKELETIANHLTELGADYIAIPTLPPKRGQIYLFIHAPETKALEAYTRDVNRFNHLTVNDKEFNFRGVENVIHSDFHFEERIPLYAAPNAGLGLPSIPLEDGLKNLQQWLAGYYNSTATTESIPLSSLVEELVDEGAVAVSLVKDLVNVTQPYYLQLRAHMPPVPGRQIAGQYKTVLVHDIAYKFDIEPVLYGPEFFGKRPIFVDDSVAGIDPVPIEWGVRDTRTYLQALRKENLRSRYNYGDQINGHQIIQDVVDSVCSGWEVTVGAEHEETGREVWVLNAGLSDVYEVSTSTNECGGLRTISEFEDLMAAFDRFDELLLAEEAN